MASGGADFIKPMADVMLQYIEYWSRVHTATEKKRAVVMAWLALLETNMSDTSGRFALNTIAGHRCINFIMDLLPKVKPESFSLTMFDVVKDMGVKAPSVICGMITPLSDDAYMYVAKVMVEVASRTLAPKPTSQKADAVDAAPGAAKPPSVWGQTPVFSLPVAQVNASRSNTNSDEDVSHEEFESDEGEEGDDDLFNPDNEMCEVVHVKGHARCMGWVIRETNRNMGDVPQNDDFFRRTWTARPGDMFKARTSHNKEAFYFSLRVARKYTDVFGPTKNYKLFKFLLDHNTIVYFYNKEDAYAQEYLKELKKNSKNVIVDVN